MATIEEKMANRAAEQNYLQIKSRYANCRILIN
jgi:hypothetical protein